MRIVNIDSETLYIFWTTGGFSMKFSVKLKLMMILIVTKNQGFTLSPENTFLEKSQVGIKLTHTHTHTHTRTRTQTHTLRHSSSSSHLRLKLKFHAYINSNIQNSIMMFTFSIYDPNNISLQIWSKTPKLSILAEIWHIYESEYAEFNGDVPLFNFE